MGLLYFDHFFLHQVRRGGVFWNTCSGQFRTVGLSPPHVRIEFWVEPESCEIHTNLIRACRAYKGYNPGVVFVAKSIVSLLHTASISWMLVQHGDLAALTVISTDPGTEWCLELLLTGSRRLAGNYDWSAGAGWIVQLAKCTRRHQGNWLLATETFFRSS
jgi:hypothetical protein